MKTKSRSVGLLESVREDLKSCRHGPAPWYDRVAPEYVKELNSIKTAWQAGELGGRKKTLARKISDRLRSMGISEVGPQGVIAWLEKA